MFCANCGKEEINNGKFCVYCGAPKSPGDARETDFDTAEESPTASEPYEEKEIRSIFADEPENAAPSALSLTVPDAEHSAEISPAAVRSAPTGQPAELPANIRGTLPEEPERLYTAGQLILCLAAAAVMAIAAGIFAGLYFLS